MAAVNKALKRRIDAVFDFTRFFSAAGGNSRSAVSEFINYTNVKAVEECP